MSEVYCTFFKKDFGMLGYGYNYIFVRSNSITPPASGKLPFSKPSGYTGTVSVQAILVEPADVSL